MSANLISLVKQLHIDLPHVPIVQTESIKMMPVDTPIMSSLVLTVFLTFFLLRPFIMAAIFYLIENPEVLNPVSDEDTEKFKGMMEKVCPFLHVCLTPCVFLQLNAMLDRVSTPKKFAMGVLDLLLDNIISIIIICLVFVSSMDNISGVSVPAESKHSVVASFLEFRDDIVPNATVVHSLTLDVDEFIGYSKVECMCVRVCLGNSIQGAIHQTWST